MQCKVQSAERKVKSKKLHGYGSFGGIGSGRNKVLLPPYLPYGYFGEGVVVVGDTTGLYAFSTTAKMATKTTTTNGEFFAHFAFDDRRRRKNYLLRVSSCQRIQNLRLKYRTKVRRSQFVCG